jgi:hypothetical protein
VVLGLHETTRGDPASAHADSEGAGRDDGAHYEARNSVPHTSQFCNVHAPDEGASYSAMGRVRTPFCT